ncbi:hypothetical protein COY05_01615 [Candidatus Peregrinibacteria bacterium CG_4_10_14_0_2_um_filter_38_24]|nr:MAG: hypothetical protein COY05_01615 [Candidatus Peregrinibacteria bacterium CG_4_10_14_0_2_um_filter_38_24]PJC38893.1 MAG: hypothetical protein CO044_02565 [Candidatus Peregrinibacteria bacterium CG_4_9_14_0_2_um_filter_38_9]
MIIGLTGSMGCGKGEIVKILEKEGFSYITLSMLVREEARKRGIEEEREKLMEVGNSMRREEGAGVLARRAVAKILASGHDKWVIDGIRNPAEIDEIRNVTEVEGKDFRPFVAGVNTEREILISRILSRARESDAKTKDEIIRKIDRELGVGEPEDGQQVAKCLEKVDIVVDNNGTLAELSNGFLDWYNKKNMTYKRPSKDEYYMDLAKSVSRRGTCTKVEIGAVIIRDDQVVATGYVGSPRGTKSSMDHGFCLRKKLGIPSGHRYEMCRSVHAEQNAIINAARSGTSLLGGDMYIFGKMQGESEELLDAFPCFICKKMLINCGLKRVICSLKDGSSKIFNVEDWMNEWSQNDIIDDKDQYGVRTDDVKVS